MSETERDVARAWRLWKAAEKRIGTDYRDASPEARDRLLVAHDGLRAALDAALDAELRYTERGEG